MPYTRTQKKEAYKQLPPEVQDFIMDNETTEKIAGLLKKAGLSEEQSDLADSEILYTLFGLQSPDTAIQNIADVCKRDISSFSELRANLDAEIFSRVTKDLEGLWKNPKPPRQESAITSNPPNKLGESFEQVILNQARGMMPAKPAEPAGGIMNHELGIMGKKDQAPENLPSEENSGPDISVPNYSKNDPYREPIE